MKSQTAKRLRCGAIIATTIAQSIRIMLGTVVMAAVWAAAVEALPTLRRSRRMARMGIPADRLAADAVADAVAVPLAMQVVAAVVADPAVVADSHRRTEDITVVAVKVTVVAVEVTVVAVKVTVVAVKVTAVAVCIDKVPTASPRLAAAARVADLMADLMADLATHAAPADTRQQAFQVTLPHVVVKAAAALFEDC